jgi:6-phosphogluconolactonase (cycloisomerase 2 family)
MEHTDDVRFPHDILGKISRRGLLKGAAALAAASTMTRVAPARAWGGTMLAYVGTYTGAVGSGGNGQGIYLFSVDPSTGILTQIKVAATVPSPSWLAIHPRGNFLYAVNEISNFNGGTTGSVSAFAIDTTTGDLTFLNVVSSQGSGPAHLSVDPLGQFVFVANYGGGSIAVLPILSNGSLGNATDVHVDVGSVGPTHATNAPPGSFAISGHDAPHAHMIQADAAGQFVLSTDLGQDRIYSWILDRSTGKLFSNTPAFTAVPPGDGPRHFAFHPNGNWVYSLQEEASTLLFFAYDPASGALTQQQMVSTLPNGFVGTNFTSEVVVSADGDFVYAANRLHDSIGIFRVNALGRLRHVGEAWTRGDYPRSFNIDPTGSYLFSCNQRSDAITSYCIEDGGHRLAFTGQYTPVGSPASIVFLVTP